MGGPGPGQYACSFFWGLPWVVLQLEGLELDSGEDFLMWKYKLWDGGLRVVWALSLERFPGWHSRFPRSCVACPHVRLSYLF